MRPRVYFCLVVALALQLSIAGSIADDISDWMDVDAANGSYAVVAHPDSIDALALDLEVWPDTLDDVRLNSTFNQSSSVSLE